MNSATRPLAAALTALILTATPTAFAASDTPVSAATIEAAKTPAEHTALAKMFEDEAASLTKKSEMHGEIAKSNAHPGGKPFQARVAQHCAALAKDYKAAAKQNLELAAIHHKLAEGAAQ